MEKKWSDFVNAKKWSDFASEKKWSDFVSEKSGAYRKPEKMERLCKKVW